MITTAVAHLAVSSPFFGRGPRSPLASPSSAVIRNAHWVDATLVFAPSDRPRSVPAAWAVSFLSFLYTQLVNPSPPCLVDGITTRTHAYDGAHPHAAFVLTPPYSPFRTTDTVMLPRGSPVDDALARMRSSLSPRRPSAAAASYIVRRPAAAVCATPPRVLVNQSRMWISGLRACRGSDDPSPPDDLSHSALKPAHTGAAAATLQSPCSREPRQLLVEQASSCARCVREYQEPRKRIHRGTDAAFGLNDFLRAGGRRFRPPMLLCFPPPFDVQSPLHAQDLRRALA
ncbi:hypothetical protein DFH06DRAFT_1336597 [Mycena polygramma]|nr:hypothetical protein DFH06DRAFT_1336597 [Mycena polygramma]